MGSAIDYANDEPNNILVVDDTPENLTILTRILTEQGYFVRPAINAQIALTTVHKTLPDLILLDIMMPGMDGYELCERLKADDRTREIPVVFISALNDTVNKVRAFQSGGVDYVTKPFQAEEVLARVKTHLTLRNMQRALQAHNQQLQQEITEREQAEASLRQRNRELFLLNQMSQKLQQCHSEAETYAVMAEDCARLFPDNPGSISLLNPTSSTLREVAVWGDYLAAYRIQQLVECERGGNNGKPGDIEHVCAALQHSAIAGKQFLCVPIRTSGTTLGLFVILVEHGRDLQTWQMLVTRITEYYALSLVNLRLRERLRMESIRDPLTNLYNRRYMEEILEQEASRAKRRGTTVGILMLDIDHFKRLNDTYGHEAGDAILQELGGLLQRSIRGGDTACRYGGEEFLLILPEANLKATERRAQELLEQVREMAVLYQERTFRITISIGVAALPTHGPSIQDTVRASDVALYQAKRNGRDQVVVASNTGETT
jgi:diguanylate cyclase (GGDEF)-like protein